MNVTLTRARAAVLQGIIFLLEHGFVRSMEPTDIAKFLLATDGLSKAAIGEYLGEG